MVRDEKTPPCPENGQGGDASPGVLRPQQLVPLPVTDDGEGPRSLYGQCAPFCRDAGPAKGQSVREHGPWCMTSVAGVDARDLQDERVGLQVELVQPYWHGTYAAGTVLDGQAEVRLVLAGGGGLAADDESGKALHVSLGDARRLAASLLHAADAGDRLLGDPNTARARREHRL